MIFIINCVISKSKKDMYSYNLKLSKDSIIYSSKELFFNKEINLNNHTILDINFPDYQEFGNYYNRLIINNCELEITNNRHIYIFNFNNNIIYIMK